MKRKCSEAAMSIAEADTKVAINKVAEKKLQMQGTYSQKLKDKDTVTINPDKPDMIGKGPPGSTI